MQPVRWITALFVTTVALGSLTGCQQGQESPAATDSSADDPKHAERASVPSGPIPPPLLGNLPAVKLEDRNGAEFSTEQMRGKIWIANFIFTRCAGVCPRQSQKLAGLQPMLAGMAGPERLGWMSVSVDPEHDRPKVMKEYAARWDADDRWRFLTGTREEIWAWIKDGFHLPVGDNPEPNGMPIIHSSKFVLIDANGAVRGYYESLEEGGLDDLPEDLQFVLDEQQDKISQAEEAAAVSSLPKVQVPADAGRVSWMKPRAKQQKEAASGSKANLDFRFVDRRAESGIDFLHRGVEDTGRTYKAVHYDHGNSVVAADVDGDGHSDLYFVNQIGRSELWRNQGNGRFEEITDRAGVAVGDRITVAASFADVDNDGDPDLYVTSIRKGNLLFLNDGKGKFRDATAKSGLGYRGHSSAALFFDYDRDGLLDLFLANVGEYTSETVRKAVSEGKPYEFYDGYKDAFGGHLKPERTEKSRLFRNLGGARFEDVTEAVGLDEPSWTGDALPIDANRDGWLDLYVLNMQGHDQYWENQQGKSFVQRSRELFPKTPWGSMGAQRLDFNNDGNFDIYLVDMHSDMSQEVGVELEKQKSEMKWPAAFLRSGGNSVYGNAFFVGQGADSFVERSDALGLETYWPWGCSAGDLNADGFDDLFVTGGMSYPFRYGVNSLLINERGQRFIDAEFVVNAEPRRRDRTSQPWFTLDCDDADKAHKVCAGKSGTIEVVGTLSSRASVLLDLEGDGDLDIVTGDFHSPPMVMINDLAQRHQIQYLKVQLEGTKSNRSGLGAVVRVKTSDGTTLMKTMDGKSGYLSHSLLPLYFGLGDRGVESIEIEWPSGGRQTVTGPIEANQLLRIREES